MIRNDIREKHEEEFKETNEKPLSVCSGRFYVSNRKEYIYCQNCTKCHKNKRYHMRLKDVPEVRFKHAESFRRCKLYEQTINEDYITTVSVFNALYVNDLACSAILEILDDIKYRDKEAQKIYRALNKRRSSYLREIHKKVKEFANEDDFADFNSLMDDEAEPIVEELRESVYEELVKKGIQDAEYISKVEVARALVGYAVYSIETRNAECKRYGIDFVYLHLLSLSDMKKVMDNFSDWEMRKIDGVNLAQERFMEIISRLGKTLTNYGKITEFIGRTIDKKYFKEEK